MNRINTDKTIEILSEIFSRFGILKVTCSDNEVQFVNPKFKHFLNSNGIVHKRSAPYNPSPNGQAEFYGLSKIDSPLLNGKK